MINWKRKIDANLYNISFSPTTTTKLWDIRKLTPDSISTFEISYFQLVVSIGKSLLSHCEKYTPEAASFARAYFQTIPFILNEKSNYLSINNENKDILRDFSKTTRIGEIAQGINYYYFKKYMNVCSIYDYKLYAKKHYKSTVGQSPDYVLVYNDGTLGLMESKGTLQPNPSEFIKNGKKQCIDGFACLCPYVSNAYVSVADFATSSNRMKRNTSLYIVDPQYDSDWKGTDIDKHIKNEYAKWFYLLGMENEYNILKGGRNLTNNNLPYIEDRNNRIVLRQFEFFTSEKCTIEFGILPWAKEYLMKGNNYFELSKYNPSNNRSNENIEVFPDGMYVELHNQRKV